MISEIYVGYPPSDIVDWVRNNYISDMSKIPLHFYTNENNINVSLKITNNCEFIYSTDEMKTWNDYDGHSVQLDECENKTVYIQAKYGDTEDNPNKNGLNGCEFCTKHTDDIQTYTINADGNIQFLLDNTGLRTDVPPYAYQNLFANCTQLTHAPELPATTLTEYCYNNMFSNCESLTWAPKLPATTLAEGCYYSMFKNCTSLTSTPKLNAKKLIDNCYAYMFSGCSNLININVNFTKWNPTNATENWVYNVASSGTFTCQIILPNIYSSSNIPEGWLIDTYIDPSIKKINIPTLNNFEYNGAEQSINNITNEGYIIEGQTTATNVDTYTVTLKLNEDYIWEDETIDDKTITWSITKAENKWEIPPTLIPNEWREDLQAGILTEGIAKFGTVTVKLNDSTFNNELPTEPDEYTLTFTVEGTDNYTELTKTINFKIIDKPDLNENYFSNLNSLIYDGTEQPIIITDESDNYEASGTITATDAGEYSFTITPKDGYEWPDNTSDSKSFTWKIDKAENEWITIPSISKSSWYNYEEDGTITNGSAMYGQIIMMLNGKIITKLPSEPGEYTLEFIVEETNNYNRLIKTINFEILEQNVVNPLTFRSIGDSTIQLVHGKYHRDYNSFMYQIDNNKPKEYEYRQIIELSNGQKLKMYATESGNINTISSEYALPDNCDKFVMTGKIAASGNINTLIKSDGQIDGLSKFCYGYLFNDCSSLIQAPELPATTLANNCYDCMFLNCTSLTQAPELPATELANGCYMHMFSGCSSLTSIPELPAETLAEYCCQYMFKNCTSLTQAPELPAITLAKQCYQYMFSGCTALTQAPSILPATTLANNCYDCMFLNCTSLTQAPELPATELANGCYMSMFEGCSNLNSISVKLLSWYIEDQLDYIDETLHWLSGVASSGTFTCSNALPEIRGTSNIPINWIVKNLESDESIIPDEPAFKLTDPLCFTAEQAGSTVKMSKNGSAPDVYLETSPTGEEGSWTDFIVDTTEITLENVGDKVYFRAKQENERFGTSLNSYNKFVMTGKIAASGNLNTLLKADGSVLNLAGKDYCYYRIFGECTVLSKAPELPATTLATECYDSMFVRCVSLIKAPSKLPATTLAEHCCWYMFRGCTALTQAPELPATELANQCYSEMFQECISLTKASFPNLNKEIVTTKIINKQYTFCNTVNGIEITCKDGIIIF